MTTEHIVAQYNILSSAYMKAVVKFLDEKDRLGDSTEDDDIEYLQLLESDYMDKQDVFCAFAKHDWK